MHVFLKYIRRYRWYILIGLVALSGILYTFSQRESGPTGTTVRVERGDIEELVSVSGTLRPTDTASLSFAQNGTVASVTVKEGAVVTRGDILASLDNRREEADRKDAEAYLAIQRANRDELLRGPREEAREVTALSVTRAENELARTIREQDELVENARRTLLSSSLAAVPEDSDEDAEPPTITGTYTCDKEGEYILDAYSSSGGGAAYRLFGLGSGTFKAETASAQPLGTCGLYVQFDARSSYGDSKWTVAVPNTRSAIYVTNLNAYNLAKERRANAVAAAEDALEQAKKNQILENAVPRDEALRRANASVQQAEARLAAIVAGIENRRIRAPFNGVVAEVGLVLGEDSGGKNITLVSDSGFELRVRIPEIDIMKLALGDTARISFDAKDEELIATIGFISPTATTIDGVSYYEAFLYLTENPDWLRGGLSADVEIVTDKQENVLRIPERYVRRTENGAEVFIPEGHTKTARPVTLGFRGNDGFVEVTDLSEGTLIITP